MEPCLGEVTYTDFAPHGVTLLRMDCSCGAELGTHLIQEKTRFWCDRVITREDAIEGLSEALYLHREGISMNEYMGFDPDDT